MATLSDMHVAVVDAIHQALPVLETVRAYTVGGVVNTPAALVELEAVEEGDDDGTDRVPLRTTWTVHCLLSHRTPEVEREVRDFAAQVFGIVRRNRWGLPALIPEVLQAGPGEFSTGQDGYEGWYVSWEQVLFVGTDVWSGDGTLPDTVFVGYAPDIGEGGDYTEVTE